MALLFDDQELRDRRMQTLLQTATEIQRTQLLKQQQARELAQNQSTEQLGYAKLGYRPSMPGETATMNGPLGQSYVQDPNILKNSLNADKMELQKQMIEYRRQRLAQMRVSQGIVEEGKNITDPVQIGDKTYTNQADARKFLTQLGDSNSQMMRISASSNTIMSHIGEGFDTILKAKMQKIPAAQAIRATAQKISGDPSITNLNMARHVITSEFARVLNGIEATEGQRAEVNDALGKNPGLDQYSSALKIISRLARERVAPFESQHKQILGKDAGDRLFNRDSKIIYAKLNMPKGAVKYSPSTDKYYDEKGNVIDG